MSTRSRIGYMRADGTVVSVYCHSDGYLSGVGKTLLDNYKYLEDVIAITELGDISYLGCTLDYPNDDDYVNGTRDYNRWRDEGTHSLESYCAIDFLKCAQDSWGDYAYLFKDGHWYYVTMWDRLPGFKPLTWEAINEEH